MSKNCIMRVVNVLVLIFVYINFDKVNLIYIRNVS